MAAQVAAVGSLLAAAASAGAAPESERRTPPDPAAEASSDDVADRLARALGGSGGTAKKCGCTPCWGPPAPPAWTAPAEVET